MYVVAVGSKLYTWKHCVDDNQINIKTIESTRIGEVHREQIQTLSSYRKHCLILTNTGHVYGYGNNKHNALGMGKKSQHLDVMTKININDVKYALASNTSSIFLTSDNKIHYAGEMEIYAQNKWYMKDRDSDKNIVNIDLKNDIDIVDIRYFDHQIFITDDTGQLYNFELPKDKVRNVKAINERYEDITEFNIYGRSRDYLCIIFTGYDNESISDTAMTYVMIISFRYGFSYVRNITEKLLPLVILKVISLRDELFFILCEGGELYSLEATNDDCEVWSHEPQKILLPPIVRISLSYDTLLVISSTNQLYTICVSPDKNLILCKIMLPQGKIILSNEETPRNTRFQKRSR